MIGTQDMPFSIADRPAPPGRAAADDETLQALERMLADPDERLIGNEAPATRGPLDPCALTRELLERLDTLGAAGQRNVMGRVVSALETEAEVETSSLGEGNRRTFCEQLGRLRHEADRPWPDAASFCRRAEDLIEMVESPARAMALTFPPRAPRSP